MSLTVFAAVMTAALMHATWNVIVKSAPDKFLTMILVASTAAVFAALALPFLPSLAPAAWPYIAASLLLQILYYVLVANAYHLADLSQAYPLMRGCAPLLVALVTVLRLGEHLSVTAWLGVSAICAGILAAAGGARAGSRRGIQLALGNAVVIAAYTLIDGMGVRRAGTPETYTLWIFLLTGAPLALWALLQRRAAFTAYVGRHWHLGLVGGIGTTASYSLALWAMTLAPVAVVAALRETSILFGTAIAALVLHEPVGPRRIVSACVIAGGAVALRLA